MTDVELFQNFHMVNVHFPNGSKSYTYKVHPDIALEVGDFVVVEVNDVYHVVTVCEINVLPSPEYKRKYKWIVCKVDTKMYMQLLDTEREMEQVILVACAKAEKERLQKQLEVLLQGEALERLKALSST